MNIEFLAAVKKGDIEKIKALLEHDRGLVNAKAETGESAILLAMYHGQRGVANLLWDYGAAVNIWEAAAVGATDRVNDLVEIDPGLIHSQSHDGFTPLQLAAFFGNAHTVKWLAALGSNVNAISKNSTFARGVPVLQSAVASGNRDVVKILLEHGANVNVLNEQEGTPLYLTAYEGNVEMVKLLLAGGADRNLKTKDGETPLKIAEARGHYPVVELLKDQ